MSKEFTKRRYHFEKMQRFQTELNNLTARLENYEEIGASRSVLNRVKRQVKAKQDEVNAERKEVRKYTEENSRSFTLFEFDMRKNMWYIRKTLLNQLEHARNRRDKMKEIGHSSNVKRYEEKINRLQTRIAKIEDTIKLNTPEGAIHWTV